MLNALRRAGADVESLILEEPNYILRDLGTKIFHRVFTHRNFLLDRTPRRQALIRRELKAKLPGKTYELILSPSSKYIAALPSSVPAAFWTDAVFSGMIDYYPEFSGLTRGSIQQGDVVERQALDQARVALYSSKWAADGAKRFSPRNSGKIKMVPFGANLSDEPSADDIVAMIQRRRGRVKLLFAGVDWQRKGGAFALEIVKHARALGVAVELDLVGATPPPYDLVGLTDVRAHGFISKSQAEGRAKIRSLMSEAHWLILPTRAECCAVVLAEAAAHGVPALTTDVGGNGTAVLHSKTGFTFPLSAASDQWAQKIKEFHDAPERYAAMARAARSHYDQTINWNVSGETALAEFELALRQGHGKRPAFSKPPFSALTGKMSQ
jgi:glycosyltransferase involved in cell wall biosynthesis